MMYDIEKKILEEKLGDMFKIISPIGSGSSGMVWAAEYIKSMGGIAKGTECAIKEPIAPKKGPRKKDIVSRFREQYRAGINHPNVVGIYDLVEVGFESFLVMEACQTNLRLVLRRKEFSIDESVGVISDICRGLQEIHHRGYYHRDINPTNILLGYNGKYKVGDLGLIKKSMDKSSNVQGALNYIPLEQCVKELEDLNNEEAEKLLDADARADIFAVGVVFYELLSGEPPFESASNGDWQKLNALKEDMDFVNNLKIKGVDERIMRIIRRCLQKEWNLGELRERLGRNPRPEEYRYQTIKELLDNLEGKSPDYISYINSICTEMQSYLTNKREFGVTALSDVKEILSRRKCLESYVKINNLSSNSDVVAKSQEINRMVSEQRKNDYKTIWALARLDENIDNVKATLMQKGGCKSWNEYLEKNKSMINLYHQLCVADYWDFTKCGADPNKEEEIKEIERNCVRFMEDLLKHA